MTDNPEKHDATEFDCGAFRFEIGDESESWTKDEVSKTDESGLRTIAERVEFD
jgi:hypothetical protein